LLGGIGQNAFFDGRFAFVGAELMQNLKINIGSNTADELLIYAPKRNVKIRLGKAPFHTTRLAIDGAVNFNQEVNATALMWDFQSASNLLGYDREISKLYIALKPGYNGQEVKAKIQQVIGKTTFAVRTNLEKNELIFRTSKSERLVVFIILLFVFILAAFNLVASLTMLYVEKKDSVKLLSAIGMTKNDLFRIFFYEGLLISGAGIFFGLMAGYLVCILQLKSELLIIPGANVPFPIVCSLSDFILILSSVSALSFIFSYFPVRLIVKSA
jgi:lipoprotein-releasing system permease protein